MDVVRLALIAIASFCIGISRRSRLWKLGVKQTEQRSTVTVACPFCPVMISDGVANSNFDMKVLDVSGILAERLVDR